MCPASFLVRKRNTITSFVFEDLFNRTNGNVQNGWLDGSGVVSNDGNWLIENGALKTGALSLSSGIIDNAYYPLLREAGTVTQDFSVDLLANNSQGFCWGYVNGMNTWYLNLNPDGTTFNIVCVTGGVRVTDQVQTVSSGNTGRYRIRYDNTGSVMVNDPVGTLHTATGTAHAGTKAGLISAGVNTRAWDNFLAPGKVSFSDYFNRSDRQLFGDNGWLGDVWSIVSNKAVLTNGSSAENADGYAHLFRNAISDTLHIVEAYCTPATGGGVGPAWRILDASNLFYVRLSDSGNISLRRFNSTRTELATATVSVGPHLIRAEHNYTAQTIKIFSDDVQVISITNSELSAPGSRVGVTGFITNDMVDNFLTTL